MAWKYVLRRPRHWADPRRLSRCPCVLELTPRAGLNFELGRGRGSRGGLFCRPVHFLPESSFLFVSPLLAGPHAPCRPVFVSESAAISRVTAYLFTSVSPAPRITPKIALHQSLLHPHGFSVRAHKMLNRYINIS